MKQLLGKAATCMGDQLAGLWLRYYPDPLNCDLWRSPAESLRDHFVDCDDLALVAGSILLACGLDETWLVVGTCNGVGHAWVEGHEGGRFFCFEATSGEVVWDARPADLFPALFVSPIYGCFDANLRLVA
jgi:hypothetical protein